VAGFEPAAEPASGFDPLGWAWGQCTAFAAMVAGWVQGGVKGNADNWLSSGEAAGLATSKTPAPGDIAVFSSAFPGSSGYGHVAVVTGLNGDEFSVAQGNVEGLDVASAGEYSDSSPYLEGFLVPPTAAAAAATATDAAYDVTSAGEASPATAASTSSAPASSSPASPSLGQSLGQQAALGLSGAFDQLDAAISTPVLIALLVAVVVTYVGFSSKLDGGPQSAV
jgi:hypothetical protein